MNASDLRRIIARSTHQSQDFVGAAMDVFLAEISGALKAGTKVQLRGFGTFEVRRRPAHRGYNPSTGKTIEIPEKNIVHFRPSTALVSTVNAQANATLTAG